MDILMLHRGRTVPTATRQRPWMRWREGEGLIPLSTSGGRTWLVHVRKARVDKIQHVISHAGGNALKNDDEAQQ